MPDELNFNPVGLALNAGLGLAQTVSGLINSGKLKKEAGRLERSRPKREISPIYGENVALAESELGTGMSARAEAAYNAALNQEQSASLSAILKGGGDVNSISSVYGAGERGRQRLTMLMDQLRLNQIRNVLGSREALADEQDKNFLFNKYAPWKDKQMAVSEQRQAANKQIWSGLQTFAGGLGYLAGEPNDGNGGGKRGTYSAVSAGVSPVTSTEPNFNLSNPNIARRNSMMTEDYYNVPLDNAYQYE